MRPCIGPRTMVEITYSSPERASPAHDHRRRRAIGGLLKLVHGLALLTAVWIAPATSAQGQPRQVITIRGHEQTLYLYGSPTGDPIIVSSGDGGWMHLAPHVAQLLGAKGFFVVGFDARAYLSGFTSGTTTLRPEEVPGDYRELARLAARATGKKPILVGVSEGAGLSVLAATDSRTKAAIAGVIGLGLPDLNELGWRWKDSFIYLTHQVPNEPTISTAVIADKVAPLPLAGIHSTHDEFVPIAEVQNIFRHAGEPKQLWIVEAGNHRFSGNVAEFDRRLVEAIFWVSEHAPR
jgi:alpha-beta hydrolase superfamily lysophospholipase